MDQTAFEGSGVGCGRWGSPLGSGFGDGRFCGNGRPGYGHGHGHGYGVFGVDGAGCGCGSLVVGVEDGFCYGAGYGLGSGSGGGYGFMVGTDRLNGSGYSDRYGDKYGGVVGLYVDDCWRRQRNGSGYSRLHVGNSADAQAAEAYYAALTDIPAARKARRNGAVVALWLSDLNGLPMNIGKKFGVLPAKPGDVHRADGPLRLCEAGTLHATFRPDKWLGSRLWVVALYGPVAISEDKLGSLRREIIAEIKWGGGVIEPGSPNALCIIGDRT